MCCTKLIFLLSIFVLPIRRAAQEEQPPGATPGTIKYSLRMNAAISPPLSPLAFKNNFYPVGDGNLDLSFGIVKGLVAGLSLRYSGFQVDPREANKPDTVLTGIDGDEILPIRTFQNHWFAGINIGYDLWTSDVLGFNFGFTTSQVFTRYSRVRKKIENISRSAYDFNTWAVEPSVALLFKFEENLALSFKVSYTYINRDFRPETLALNDGSISYTQNDLQGKIRFFSIGLGFVYSLKPIE